MDLSALIISTFWRRPGAVPAEVDVGDGAIFDGAVVLGVVLHARVLRNLEKAFMRENYSFRDSEIIWLLHF